MPKAKPIPTPNGETSLRALRAMLRERHPLAAMQVFHQELGDIFRIGLPGFSPIVMVGPQATRFVLVEARDQLRWRNENDPVTDLLRHGVLVEDGDSHDELRRLMNPTLHRRMLEDYLLAMWDRTGQVLEKWQDGETLDMLVEMRKITLLILMDTLFGVDFTPQLRTLWDAVIGSIKYISPGLWMFWRSAPRPQYQHHIRKMDQYLYAIIRERRAGLDNGQEGGTNLLSVLIQSGMEDDLIRDQMLTMLIAGHDTSTALLAWTLYLLGSHPEDYRRVKEEIRGGLILGVEAASISELNNLDYLGQVVKESLRLYPPIHLGNRLAAADLDYKGYHIPAGERVIYSIYLTQRHPDIWQDPDRFIPERHGAGAHPAPYAWLPFGGGPRNCIGGAFGLLETKVVLARILMEYNLRLVEPRVHPHMGATLEPSPGVRMQVHRW